MEPLGKQERKQQSHEAILDSASRLMRERGIHASSIGDVMQGAGLTVGGFYGHFDSKEALFAATIQRTARAVWDRMLARAAKGGSALSIRAIISAYLSPAHRDHPESGCLLPSTAAEIAQTGEPYRSALVGELERFVTSLSPLLHTPKRRQQAIALIALLYGALSIARATKDTPFSDEVLVAAKQMAERWVGANAGTASAEPR